MSYTPASRSIDESRAMIAPLMREPVERYVLSNGLTVLLKQDCSNAVCSAQVWVKTGSIHEGKHLGAGISHFVEHMLFKGTEKREGKRISEEIQEAGGYINA
ncbi:MAG: insulinase family protein, partial [Verrucomicrobiota bacterium]